MKLQDIISNADLLTRMKIPSEWDDVLSRLKQIYGDDDVFIAGGCLRDLYYGKPIKDVDIFIRTTEAKPQYIVTHFFDGERLSTRTIDAKTTEAIDFLQYMASLHAGSDDDSGIAALEKIKEEHNTKVSQRPIYFLYKTESKSYKYDIIFGKPDTCDISKFDLSICQIKYNGGLNITTTKDFDLTAETKVIKICNINRVDRQKTRINRIKEKYGEFEIDENCDFSNADMLDFDNDHQFNVTSTDIAEQSGINKNFIESYYK